MKIKKRNIIENTKAKVLPLTIMTMLILASITGLFLNYGEVVKADSVNSKFVFDGDYGTEQGLGSDGVFLYIGLNNGNGVNGSIKKVFSNNGTVISTWNTAPFHAAGCEYRHSTNTLFVSSGGTPQYITIRELNLTDGSCLREWNLTNELSGNGGLFKLSGTILGHITANLFIVLTTNYPGDLSICMAKVRLYDNETYKIEGMGNYSSMGLAQGGTYNNDSFFFYTDHDGSHKRITRFNLTDITNPTIIESFYPEQTEEGEGCTFHDGRLFYGLRNGSYYSTDIYWVPEVSFSSINNKQSGEETTSNERNIIFTSSLFVDRYRLQIANDSDFTDVFYDKSDINSTNYASEYFYDDGYYIHFNITNIFNEGACRGDTHYYRIRAYIGD